MENLTPPATGQKRTGWSTASGTRAAGSGAAGTVAPGSVPAPAARHRNGEQIPTAHDMHRDAPGAADRTASADRRPEQQRTTRRRPGLFLLPCLHTPARPAGSAARHALGVVPPRGKAGKYPGSAGRSAWILRPPPAPGRISTASAAPDDHASSRPPHTMTTHQRQPCPTCTAPTACQPCQNSQRQRSRQRRHRGGRARQRRPPAAACIAAACRMIHPAAPRKTAILRRRRRGQILHLTG